MSASLTYGSFGDVITTIQLVHRLAQALSESRGSARELQNLVVELRLFQNVLQQLNLFWESRKQCSELQKLANVARPAIYDCKDVIEAFLERAARKYGSALLRRPGSRKTFWDLIKAIKWNLCEPEDVEKIRGQLSRNMALIEMVQVHAQGIAQDQDRTAVTNRIASLVDAETQADAKIDKHFAELLHILEKEAKTISRIEEVSNAMFSTLLSVSSNIWAIRTSILNIEQIVLMLPGMMSRLSLLKQNIAYIEDALGWNLPVLLDAHPSWETVHSIILDQFTQHRSPGLELVKLRRYALQDSITGKDITLKLPFYQVARPGQTYAMSILLHGEWNVGDDTMKESGENSCPKCAYDNAVADPEVDVTCGNTRCNLIYRRIEDVTHLDDERIQELVKKTKKRELGFHKHDENYDDDDDSDSENRDLEITGQNSLPIPESFVDGPEIFKRVRFLSSWEDRMESRGPLFISAGDVHFWDTSSIEEANIQMHVSIFVHMKAFENWVMAPERLYDIKCRYRFFTGFVGRTRGESSPVLLLIMQSKRARRRFLKVMKLLDWLGDGSRFLIMTAAPSAFGEQEFERKWRRHRVKEKEDVTDHELRSHTIRKEVHRRLRRLF